MFIFERNGNAWTERARLTAPGAEDGDQFGSALALRNNTLVVGAPGRAQNTGAAFAFERSATGVWSAGRSLAADGLVAGDGFGSAVAVDGAVALAGAPGPGGGGFLGGGGAAKSGAAYLYRRGTTGWAAAGRITTSDTLAGALGAAISLRGDDVWIGAPRTRTFGGAVYQFRQSGTTWSQAARIVRASPAGSSGFGTSLAVTGSDVLIGTPGGPGGVHVFRSTGDGTWSEVQHLTVPVVGLGTGYGASVAAGDGLAIVGGPTADFFEGIGYLYAKDAGTGEWRDRGTVADATPGLQPLVGEETRCAEGTASIFSCQDVDLVAMLPPSAVGAKRGIMLNDMWGWTDPASGREFVLQGRLDGTSFVEITNPSAPKFLGDLPLHEGARPNLWRDIKVYKNHAYIVSDGAGPHGVQIFDLTQLLRVATPPMTFRETAHYDRIASAHNIVIDTLSGFAYTVGNNSGGETCGGALHMIDLREPTAPKFAGCYADPATGTSKTGYTHDAQCTVYHGPDTRYSGRQVCFNASETAFGIGDVTDKAAPKPISSASYPNVGYSHQGWVSDDHRYFFLNDELDELSGNAPKTRTIVWDITKLDDPVVYTEFLGTTSASDHNLYVNGRYMYQSNYVAGLRIIDIADPKNPVEVGYFDTVPYGENNPGFAGSWTNYPYFKSGVIAVSSMREGLFLLRYRPKPPIP